MIEFLDSNSHRRRGTLMDMGNRRSINHQAEQFRATIVAARIHLPLTLIDQMEIKIRNHHAFT